MQKITRKLKYLLQIKHKYSLEIDYCTLNRKYRAKIRFISHENFALHCKKRLPSDSRFRFIHTVDSLQFKNLTRETDS